MKSTASNLLKKAGLRATKQRVQIIDVLSHSDTPHSIQKIASMLSNVDTVTVYRTVKTLINTQIVKEVDLRLGCSQYELTDTHDHHHVVCTKCRRIEDFTGCNISLLSDAALKQVKSFSHINSHSLEFFGTCKSCTV